VLGLSPASAGPGRRAAPRPLPAGLRRWLATAAPSPHPSSPGIYTFLQTGYVGFQFEFRANCTVSCLGFQMFHAQQSKQGGSAGGPQPPAPRPKVRARRGQATDPHSIAERVIKSIKLHRSSGHLDILFYSVACISHYHAPMLFSTGSGVGFWCESITWVNSTELDWCPLRALLDMYLFFMNSVTL
jgi:hypothetical protein